MTFFEWTWVPLTLNCLRCKCRRWIDPPPPPRCMKMQICGHEWFMFSPLKSEVCLTDKAAGFLPFNLNQDSCGLDEPSVSSRHLCENLLLQGMSCESVFRCLSGTSTCTLWWLILFKYFSFFFLLLPAFNYRWFVSSAGLRGESKHSREGRFFFFFFWWVRRDPEAPVFPVN